MYAAQRQRAGAEQSFQSKEDFFRFLEQEAELNPVSDLTLARVAQLTQKTNQFNLTTRRYTESQIAEMAKHPAWNIFSIRVRDRFGDHGIVGVAITHDQGDQCEVDTFLLSCRVIGRTIETALLAHIAKSAASAAASAWSVGSCRRRKMLRRAISTPSTNLDSWKRMAKVPSGRSISPPASALSRMG